MARTTLGKKPKNRTKTGMAAGYLRAAGLSQNARYADSLTLWAEQVTKEFLWSKQREIEESVRKFRYTAVQSAHDTGKSFVTSRIGAHWVDTRPDPFLVTTAPTWKQVNSILWREMRKAHRKGNLPGRINLDAEWYMGADELVGFGRRPADYDQSAFQGIHALNVLVLIDEAGGVPQSLFEAADALATNERARVLAIGNPDDPSSYFAKICQPGSGWNVIKISAFDTPAFTGEEIPEYLYDLLISPTWVNERKKRWGVKSPTYISKVLGEFPDISDDTLLTPKMIREAQQRTLAIEPTDKMQYGADIARFGDDETAIARAIGHKVRVLKAAPKMDTMETAEMIGNVLGGLKNVYCYVDVQGLGAGVYDRARQLRINVKEFNASWRPRDPERFLNWRAEAYWHVRDLADDGLLDLPENGEDDDLIAELGSLKWKLVGGKIAIESKDDMRKRGLPSPNRADAVAMALSKTPSYFVPQNTGPSSLVDGDGGSLTEDLLDKAM